MKKLVCKTLLVVMCISLLVLTFALGACDTDGEASLSVRFDEYTIYVDDDLETVKNHLIVTYTDPQGNSGRVTDFTLNGTLNEGNCEFTVTYNGISTVVNIYVSVPEQAFSIHFVVDGELYHEMTVKTNGFNLPKSPSKNDFEFVGWSYDVDGNQPFDATRPIDSNVELYAVWKPIVVEYTVTFITNGQTHYSYSAEAGSQIDVPTQEPSAICKAFVGWFSVDNVPMDTQQTVNSDLTFYASFETSHFSVVTDEAVPATCTESGLTEGSHCEFCGDVLVDQQEVPALDHDLQHYAAKEPTCTKDGWEAFVECQREGCDYTTFREVPTSGHQYGNFIKEVAATCEDDGVKGHYHCSVCEKDFDRYYDELTDLKIDAFQHELEHHEAQAPSCAGVGWNAYDTCTREGCTYTTYQEIAKLEHEMGEDEKCKHCGYFESGLELELSSDRYIVVGLGTFTGTDVVIPAANADGKPVTAIDESVFKGTNITSITIPASITTIMSDAFADCDSLTKVNYLGTIEQWVQVGFSTAKSNPTYYAKNLYVNDKLVTEVKLTTATKIGNYAFYNCSSLASIEIPASVTEMGWNAFEGCESFAKVNYLGTINQWAWIKFRYQESNPLYYAKNLYINDVLVTVAKFTDTWEIGKYAFYNCASLTSVETSSNVTRIGECAFYGCSNLESVTIAEGLTQIFFAAFYKCTSLKSIEIPSSVTEIRMDAFRYCTSLKSVTLPANVQLGGVTFANCSSLESIVIPNGVKRIQEFSGCTSLKSITIPASVTIIDQNAFKNCKSLEKVNYLGTIDQWAQIDFRSDDSNPLYWGAGLLYIDDKLVTEVKLTTATAINSYAFRDCNSLTSVEIPASVTSIGAKAFYRCSSLTSVTFAENSKLSLITGFDGCSSLTSIVIPDGVTKIDGSAFANCSSLASITIPASVTEMGSYVFYGCSLAKVNYLGTIDQWAQIKFGDSTSNPLNGSTLLYINNAPVTDVKITTATEISPRAFYAYGGLVSVELSSSVTSIGKEAFSKCENLISVQIPSSVTTIGSNAFYESNSLTIYCEAESKPDGWPSNLNQSYIGTVSSYTLPVVWNCKTNEVAHDGYTYAVIDGIRYALKDSEAMVAFQPKNIASELAIPSSVKYNGVDYTVTGIAYRVFYSKGNDLVSVTIPSSVTSVGSYAFYGCNRVTIYCEVASQPSDWNGIDWSYRRPIVWDCKNNVVAKPDGDILVTIDGIRYALKDGVASVACQLNNSVSVKIPSFVIYRDTSYSVTNIADDAFYYCSNLTSIEIPASVTEIYGYAFADCINLKTVTFAENSQLASIGSYAFDGCTSLASITIPASVTSIGYGAFRGCTSLASITIPSSVTKIGSYAFKDCSNLTIYCEAESQPSGWNSNWNSSNCTVVWNCKNSEAAGEENA